MGTPSLFFLISHSCCFSFFVCPFFFFFWYFLGLHLWHMEVPGLGV